MKLYHFAPAHLIDDIRKQGLILGKLPIIESKRVKFLGPCQWLTSDGDFNRQSWATQKLISYDRTAFRLTIVIPKTSRNFLYQAYEYLPHLPKMARHLITDWEGSENWYLYFGYIRPSWIRKIEEKGGG